jgi:phosphate transport system protein
MTGRYLFHEELEKLHRNLLHMGTLVEEAIHLSVKSLANRDLSLAEQVIKDDEKINDYMEIIEKDCFRLIALQQPMASDLRRIATVVKIVTDLERMGDNAVSIARATIRLKGETYIKALIDIPKMAELTKGMVRDALEAYINLSTEKSFELSKRDDEVDRLYKEIYNELLEIMKVNGNTVHQGTQFLFVAHSLERIADHATNLGEWVIYLVTGEKHTLND